MITLTYAIKHDLTVQEFITAPALQEVTPTTPAPGTTAPTPTTAPGPTPSAFVKPPKPGASITRDVMKKYVVASGGDVNKAKAQAAKDGWGAPAAQ